MGSLNKIMVIGNCGGEPEMRMTPAGKSVTSFSVAVNDKYGETEHTEWFKVTCWGKLAETVNQYLEKGQQVFVEGKIKLNQWDKDGVQHSSLEINANQLVFLGKKSGQAPEETLALPDPGELPF